MRNLDSIHTRRGNAAAGAGPGVGGNFVKPTQRKAKGKSSATLNRRREQDRIARENAIFAQRLQSVKGTKALTKKTMKRGAMQQKRLATNCRQQRPQFQS